MRNAFHTFLVWFVSLHPSQQLWSCWDGQFTIGPDKDSFCA